MEGAHRIPFTSADPGQSQAQTLSTLQPPALQTSATSPGDPMEITPPTTAMMAPPARTSPDHDSNGIHDHMGGGSSSSGMAGPNAAAAAAAGSQQPKVVQTAFIHKLYK